MFALSSMLEEVSYAQAMTLGIIDSHKLPEIPL